jgi:hypothetical protein
MYQPIYLKKKVVPQQDSVEYLGMHLNSRLMKDSKYNNKWVKCTDKWENYFHYH